NPAAAACRDVALLLAAARAALLAATAFLVYGCPGASFGFLRGNAPILVTFLDVPGLAFLLAGVTRLVATWHARPPSWSPPTMGTQRESPCSGPVPGGACQVADRSVFVATFEPVPRGLRLTGDAGVRNWADHE